METLDELQLVLASRAVDVIVDHVEDDTEADHFWYVARHLYMTEWWTTVPTYVEPAPVSGEIPWR